MEADELLSDWGFLKGAVVRRLRKRLGYSQKDFTQEVNTVDNRPC